MPRYETRAPHETWLEALSRAAKQIHDNSQEVDHRLYVLLTGISANPMVVHLLLETECLEKIGLVRHLSQELQAELAKTYAGGPLGLRQKSRCLYRVNRGQLDAVIDRALLEGYHIKSEWSEHGPKLVVTSWGKSQLPDQWWGENAVVD